MEQEVLIGMIVHYRDELGFVRPGIVIRIWDKETVNLFVIYDGTFAPDRPDMRDTCFKQSDVKRGRNPGEWDFMWITEYEVDKE